MHITFDQVKSAVRSWATKIEQTDSKYDYIIGVSRGGLVPATLLSYATEIPMKTIDIKTRKADGTQCQPETYYGDHLGEIMANSNVLFVEDIIDSGLTLSEISRIMKNRDKTFEYASIVYNTALKTQQPAFYYTTINRDYYKDWVIFPWDDWE